MTEPDKEGFNPRLFTLQVDVLPLDHRLPCIHVDKKSKNEYLSICYDQEFSESYLAIKHMKIHVTGLSAWMKRFVVLVCWRLDVPATC